MQALRNVQCCQAPSGFKKIAPTIGAENNLLGRKEQLL